MLVIGLVKLRDPETGLPSRSTTAMLVMVPVLAAVFTLAVGWERVWQRFQQNDPYLVRKEFMLAALDMAKHRPLTGYGLEPFPRSTSATRSRIFRFTSTTRTMTGQSLRQMADSLPAAGPDPVCGCDSCRRSESLGTGPDRDHAACLRGFSLSAPAVSGWMFLLLALLYMARTPDEAGVPKSRPGIAGGPSAPERA